MKQISPNALTTRRSQKSVPHPQVQSRDCGTETKRSGKAVAVGAPVGEKISRNGDLTVIPPNDEGPLVREAIGLADMTSAQMGEALVGLRKMGVRYDNMSGICATLEGLVLLQAKAMLPHGAYGGFLRDYFAKSRRAATAYTQLARAFVGGKLASTCQFDKFGRPMRVPKAFELVKQDLATSLQELEKFQLDLRHPVVSKVAEWVNGRGSYQLMLDYPAPLGGRRARREKLSLAEVRAKAEKEALESYEAICRAIDRFLKENAHTLLPKSQRVLLASLFHKAKRSLDQVAD